MLEVKKPQVGGGGEKILHVTRFLGRDGATLLSAILHGDERIAEWYNSAQEYYRYNII